jgi:hypothetical protein
LRYEKIAERSGELIMLIKDPKWKELESYS